MIIKITGYTNEEPKYYKLCDSTGNEIKDENFQLMIINILKGIKYTVDIITDELGPQERIDIEFYSIVDKKNKYKKILKEIGFCIGFRELNQEEVIEL